MTSTYPITTISLQLFQSDLSLLRSYLDKRHISMPLNQSIHCIVTDFITGIAGPYLSGFGTAIEV